MHEFLCAQAKAALDTGTRDGAYDWVSVVAHVIEDITLIEMPDDRICAGTVVNRDALSEAEAAFLESAWSQVRNGSGAP